MEYLIALLVVIGLYFVIPCKLSDLFKMKKKCEDSEMDGGEYGSKAVTKRKTNKKTKKAIKRTKWQIWLSVCGSYMDCMLYTLQTKYNVNL